MSKPPAAKRLCVDSSSIVFELVIGSGFFSWYELNDEYRVVSKDWNEAISTVLNDAPCFAQLVEHIGKLNACNICTWCEELYSECDGKWCEPDRVEKALKKKDPRCQDSFNSLSNFEKARRLYQFHAGCVSNLLSFYGEDLFIKESLLVAFRGRWHWTEQDFCGMSHLRNYNPKAFWLFTGLVDLHLAKFDLAQGIYLLFGSYYSGACRPSYDESHWVSFLEMVFKKLKGAPHEANERSFDADFPYRSVTNGRWYKSQFNHLEDIIRGMINERDLVADQLLGEQLADKIDFMHKARSMIPRLPEIFPLEWMPVFEDDYDPSDW